jgi:hypothetical protein
MLPYAAVLYQLPSRLSGSRSARALASPFDENDTFEDNVNSHYTLPSSLAAQPPQWPLPLNVVEAT